MSDITINQIYEEIIKNRNEIKNKIDASESRLLLKIQDLTFKLKEVETENVILKEEIEKLKRNNNKKNIIIFGLKQQADILTSNYLCKKLKELIDIDVTEVEISNFYRLGNSNDSPIKIEFISYLKKLAVLGNCHKLKGTNVTIAQDLTQKQRDENKILRKYLQEAKQDKKNKCYIKQNKLHINNKIYTVEDLLEIERVEEDTEEKPKSDPNTPATPNPSNHQIEDPGIKKTQTAQGDIQTPKVVGAKKPEKKGRPQLRSTNK